VPDTVLSRLAKLRRDLQDELKRDMKERSELETQLQAVGSRIESRQRALELVEATERQLRGERQGQPDLEGGGPGAGTQVRTHARSSDIHQQTRLPNGALCR
jgi:hypothetical protein